MERRSTLLERVVLVIIFLILGAAIAGPHLVRSTCCGNEISAIATLRNLRSAQALFQGAAECDLDGDRLGEFGTIGEMTGTDGIRSDPAASTRRETMVGTILLPSLAPVDADGVVTRSGHAFRVFLPGRNGKAVHEGKAGWWTGGPGSPGC